MELELIYNEETQLWEEKPEPFITIEVETEEDFEFIGNAIAFYKKHMEEQAKPQTNADRIRAMSDVELASFICGILDCYDGKCPGKHLCRPGNNGLVAWMKHPAEDKHE